MRISNAILAGAVFCAMSAGSVALAQSTILPFGGLDHDTTSPIEIVSDRFTVNHTKGTAEFDGNVVVGQGDMRLAAQNIRVEYSPDGGEESGEINLLVASGGVTLVSGAEAAEAQTATYDVKNGIILLKGDVILTQGGNAIAGQVVSVNLSDGSAKIEGRAKTVFRSGGSE